MHANVKGTKALNVISDMPCAKVRLQVGLNSLPANSLASWPAYKPLTGQMGHIEPRKVLCLQRERERESRQGRPGRRLSITVARKTPIALCHLPWPWRQQVVILVATSPVEQLNVHAHALILFAAAISDCGTQDHSILADWLPACQLSPRMQYIKFGSRS